MCSVVSESKFNDIIDYIIIRRYIGFFFINIMDRV